MVVIKCNYRIKNRNIPSNSKKRKNYIRIRKSKCKTSNLETYQHLKECQY